MNSMTYDDLYMWLNDDDRAFHVSELDKGDITSRILYLDMLEKFIKDGVIEKYGDKRGWYQTRKTDLQEMDFINADEKPIKLWMPFDIDLKVNFYPGNIIIIAGTWNAGKTAVVLNMIVNNRYQHNIHYFNSEMSASELRIRLKKFEPEGVSIEDWNFKAYHRAERFADVIFPGPGNLNIIDFLEIHDEFYVMGRRIKEIHDRLQGALCVICIQKNRGTERDMGLGGDRSMEVARLVVTLDPGRVKLTKAKNFKNPKENPNGKMRDFTLYDGYKLQCKDGWYREKGGARENDKSL